MCGPRWATLPNGESGYAGTRPKLGFKPKLPQNAAGMRTLPAPSVPIESGPMPQAMAAAVPPDDPPDVRAGFQGLRVMPVSGELVSPLQPNSGVVVLPRITAPASRTRAATGASTSHGPLGSMVREPRSVGMPATRMRSLIDIGTPSSAPHGSPRVQRSSLAPADASAASGARRQKALTAGLQPRDAAEHRARRLHWRGGARTIEPEQLGGAAVGEIRGTGHRDFSVPAANA